MDTRRIKRGISKRAGTLSKIITGNLDEAVGEYFTECINKLYQDQVKNEILLKNQINILTSSVIKNFNQNVQQLQIDEKIFKDDIEKNYLTVHLVTVKR